MSKRTIKIENLRSIKYLEFSLPEPGCYLITGANGSGKTSLLAALHRIGNSYAFRYSFPAQPNALIIDVMDGASVTYSVDKNSVKYVYRGTRWVPNPRNDAGVLNHFGFTEVHFFKADSQRLEPTQKELTSGSLNLASKEFRDALHFIFEDTRFERLTIINLSRGRSRPTYLVKEKVKSDRFFSEKQFSLGEICIIRLVENILHAKGGALLLVDELEMALHPRIQIRLLEFLRKMSNERRLTILVSTHSASMIRIAGHKSIYFLEQSPSKNGTVECHYPCYPAKATSGIAYAEEVSPDILFLVEDTRAVALLNQLLERYKILNLAKQYTRIYKIMPIGGYAQVIEFHRNAREFLFPTTTHIVSFLDLDAKNTIASIISKSMSRLKESITKIDKDLFYLPCTPEPGFINFIESEKYTHSSEIDKDFQGLNLIKILESADYLNLQDSKVKMGLLISKISEITNESENHIEKKLFGYYVNTLYSDGEIHALLGPIFNFHN